MGIICKNNADKEKLKSFANKIKAPRPKNEKAYDHCVRADGLRIQNHFEESINEYLKAILFDKSNYEAYWGLGLSYKGLGDMHNAVISLEKAKELAPFDKKKRCELGYCYCNLNKYRQALNEIKRAIKLDPGYLDAQLQLAVIHEMSNELDMAMKVYCKIISDRPSYISAYNNLGSLYIRLGLLNQAVNTFKRILRINPDFARAYLGIAVAYDKMNQISDSIRFYKKYMDLKPNSVNIPYILARLGDMKSERKSTNNSHLKLIVQNV
jgi:tetratricopeptide (TPR) repeat protein